MDQESEKNNKIVDCRYKFISTINAGLNSKVKLVQRIGSSQSLAMKMVKNKGILYSLLKNELENEISILSSLNDEHIIKIIDHNLQGELVSNKKKKEKTISYIVLEYAGKGEIFNYLKKTRGLPLPIAKYYFKQLLIGLKSMHNSNFYHRDLKLENLVLDNDYNLKILDLGFATSNEKDNKVLGTDYYMPPEMISRKEYICSKCDMYSSGVILFSFIRGSFPFKSASQYDLNYKLFLDNQEEEFWKMFGKQRFNKESVNLLSNLLSNDPNKRMTIDEVLELNFLKENMPEKQSVIQYMSKIKI